MNDDNEPSGLDKVSIQHFDELVAAAKRGNDEAVRTAVKRYVNSDTAIWAERALSDPSTGVRKLGAEILALAPGKLATESLAVLRTCADSDDLFDVRAFVAIALYRRGDTSQLVNDLVEKAKHTSNQHLVTLAKTSKPDLV